MPNFGISKKSRDVLTSSVRMAVRIMTFFKFKMLNLRPIRFAIPKATIPGNKIQRDVKEARYSVPRVTGITQGLIKPIKTEVTIPIKSPTAIILDNCKWE
jgi:hypothetical protein